MMGDLKKIVLVNARNEKVMIKSEDVFVLCKRFDDVRDRYYMEISIFQPEISIPKDAIENFRELKWGIERMREYNQKCLRLEIYSDLLRFSDGERVDDDPTETFIDLRKSDTLEKMRIDDFYKLCGRD